MSFTGYNVVEKNGAPARKRFTDPNAVRAVYQKLKEDDMKEAERRAKILKMYVGNLPYDPAQLERSGIKNITNINFLGLKGVIDNRADVILRMSSDTANLVELRPMRREIAGPDAERIARVVAEEFSFTLRDVGEFIPALARMNTEADLYGLGPMTWMTNLDYSPVALDRGQVKFLGNGPVASSKHDLIMFESVLPASYIFSIMDDPAAAESGWNVKLVKEWAVRVFLNGEETADEPGTTPGLSTLETQIGLLRRNLFEEEHQFDELKVIHVFVREMAFPRGITHLIIPSNAVGDKETDFLFSAQNAYRTMDECFLWFPYSVNEKHARSVRGLGSYLYAVEKVSNRFKCAFVDASFRGTMTMFTQQSSGAQQQITLNEQGPFMFVPKELVPVQNNVKPDLGNTIQAIQFIDSIGVSSVEGTDKPPLGTTGPKLFDSSSRQPSKYEAEIMQRMRAHKDEALFVQRAQVIDKLMRESFKRFVRLVGMAASGDPVVLADYPEVPEFIQRCGMRDVTVDQILQIPEMFTIATCRDLVLGSEGKVGVLTEMLAGPGAGLMDEIGRRNAMRDSVQLRLGVASADRYIPENSRDSAPSDQSSFATVENDMLRTGQPVSVGQDQLHWSHIPVHSQVLQEIVQTVGAPQDNNPGSQQEAEMAAQQIENPKQLLQVLVDTSKHVQEHLAIGRQQIGMEAQAKRVDAMIRDLRPTIKALNLAVATQERVEQAQREKQEREMRELQQKADENEVRKAQVAAEKKAETDRYKADLDHQVAMHRLELDRELASAKHGLDMQDAAANSRRQDLESAAKMAREDEMVKAKINSARAMDRFKSVQDGTGFGSTEPSDIVAMGPVDSDQEPPDAVNFSGM